jgi:hypothetical protein
MSPRSGTALAVLLLSASPARPQQTPSFEAARELVRIDVVALDGDGRPVRGLTADDFEIVERGRRLPITSFEAVVVSHAPPTATPGEPAGQSPGATAPAPAAPDRNRAFVVLIDDVNLGPAGAFRVTTDLKRFLSGELQDGDLVSLVTTSGLRFTARDAADGPAAQARPEDRSAAAGSRRTGARRIGAHRAARLGSRPRDAGAVPAPWRLAGPRRGARPRHRPHRVGAAHVRGEGHGRGRTLSARI